MTIKLINIFGSTGSIGTQTLEVVRKFSCYFKINILSGGDNYKLLAEQIIEFSPKAVLIKKEFLNNLKSLLPFHQNLHSMEEFENILSAYDNFSLSLMAICGFSALKYSSILIKYSSNKTIALASKESIVCGGEIFLNLAKQNSVKLIPVDSEHNSVFQLLNDDIYPIEISEVSKVIITASGGAFLNYTREQLKSIKPSDAIKNPNWSMGAKISIDSSTLMNKALELIEAHYFFKLPVDAIIHPQSVVHAIIQKQNGEEVNFISPPDMKIHISHSLFYPHKSLYISEHVIGSRLSFEEVIEPPFVFINIAKEIINNCNHLSILFNLAGEMAVQDFIDEKISFLSMNDFVIDIMDEYSVYEKPSSIQEIIELDEKIRRNVKENRSLSFKRLDRLEIVD